LVLILRLSTFCLDVHLLGFLASLLKMKLWYVDFGRNLFLKLNLRQYAIIRYSEVYGFWPVERLREAGGQVFWACSSGKGWVFMCLEFDCNKVNPAYGGGQKD